MEVRESDIRRDEKIFLINSGSLARWGQMALLYQFYIYSHIFSRYVCNIIKAIIILTVIIILNAASTYIRRHPRHLMEYTVLILLMLLFLQILVSSYNLITMFLAIIGFSLNIYVLLLFDSFNHASREAGIKYFYLSINKITYIILLKLIFLKKKFYF